MTTKHGILFLYTETFVHPGAGSTTEAIDLPVQREVHTGYPIIPASSLKGSLRDLAERQLPVPVVRDLFGQVEKDNSFAGALTIGDARLLLFPIRSLTRTFFWITSPLALARAKRDFSHAGLKVPWEVVPPPAEGQALVPEGCPVDGDLYLEEMNFRVSSSSELAQCADFLAAYLDGTRIGEHYQAKLRRDLALLRDDDFSYFVRFATQVVARIQLTSSKTTGTVQGPDGELERGNLWYEETLPPETVFYARVLANQARGKGSTLSEEEALQHLTQGVLKEQQLQVGGNETLGQGWCATFFVKG